MDRASACGAGGRRFESSRARHFSDQWVPYWGIIRIVKPISLDPDRLGTVASMACAIHCAITGVAVSVMSIVGFTYFQSPVLEWGFLGTALIFGSWAATRGYAIHKSVVPIMTFGFGFLVLAGSHFVDPHHGSSGSAGFAELFSVIGGICLVGFHYLNRQFIKAKAIGHQRSS